MIKLQQRLLLAAIVLVLCAVGAHKAFAATPSNSYCSSDSGTTWAPCPPASGSGVSETANQGTPAANSNAWPVKTAVGATGAKATSTLAGADATISAACSTCILRVITNVSGATVYLALGQTATPACCVQLLNGATYFEDRFTGAIHAYGTGDVNVSSVTP